MLAEKASDLIRREPLPPLDVPVYIAPNWATRGSDHGRSRQCVTVRRSAATGE
jgi:hypothetical protein